MCYVFLQSLQKSNQFFCFVFEIFCAIQLMQNSKKKELSKSQNHKKSYSCMSLYKYVMAISKFLNLWLLGWLLQEYIFQMSHAFQVWKFHLKINPCEEKPCLLWADCSWNQAFSSLGLIFGGEKISIPDPRPIWKSYIYSCLLFLTCTILFDLNFDCIWLQYWFDILFFRNSVILDELNDTLFLQNSLLIFFILLLL